MGATILLLGKHSREMKRSQKDLYQMLTAPLFIIAEKWIESKRPPVDEWISKIRKSQTMEYYSAIKRNEVLINAKT